MTEHKPLAKQQVKHAQKGVNAECKTLSVEEAAVVLGISRAHAYDATKDGSLPIIKIGRRLLVPRAALQRMLGEVE